ncbi:probable disease resistance RPP8-like protein 2 [Typha latifolia]|uniref:probable disease resistance RPP8-like protein 2 n=1 Tax=Typha latifolia TaxID=4733 RepID=UPI003C2E7F08
MSESVVSSVVRKLGDLLLQEAVFLHGVRDLIKTAQRELSRMNCFLADADSKRKADERVKHWVKEIRDVAHQIEDVVDTYLVEVGRSHRRDVGVVKRYVLKCVSKPNELVARHKVGDQITAILAKIQEISASRTAYGIDNLGSSGGGEGRPLTLRRPIIPDVDDSEVVGFESDKESIIDRLVAGGSRRRVVSIVGTGGLGKTTLARKAYNSSKVKAHFDFRIWLTISQEYKLVDLLKNILEKRGKMEKEELGKDEGYFIEQLMPSLRCVRYLIVMDDVWNDVVWDRIREAFPDENNGSRVLFTSRFLKVAKRADPGSVPYELRFLDEEESLQLLFKKAFPNEDPSAGCPPDLMRLAQQQLVKRCGGLPLALVVLGGLLSIRERTYGAWHRVAQTLDWQSDGKECMDILAMSYEDLPSSLKPCFMYLASFPEDYKIPAGSLTKMWIAEGFISQGTRGTLEETAESFLEELIQRCMVQVAQRSSSLSGVKACRVHDLLRDLALSEAKEDGFLAVHQNGTNDEPFEARRAALHNNEIVDLRRLTTPNLRSILSFGSSNPQGVEGFKLLKVMELNGARHLRHLPEEIKYMVHLRYLGLRHSRLRQLPSSIGRLRSLQTLDVRDTKISCVPDPVWGIKVLRHVHISRKKLVFGPPPSADLRDLQTLGLVNLPETWITLGGGTLLSNLTGLRKLKLCNWHGRIGWKAVNSLLEKQKQLVSLTLIALGSGIPEEMDTRTSPSHEHIQEMRLDGEWLRSRLIDAIEFPPHLTKLTLTESGLEQDPMPKLAQLRSLRTLRLGYRAYVGKKMSCCSVGGFPQLLSLEVRHLDQLEEWKVEDNAMPQLKRLQIEECYYLRELPELQYVTTLQELRLFGMPREFCLRLDKGKGKDWHKVHHVPSLLNKKDEPS